MKKSLAASGPNFIPSAWNKEDFVLLPAYPQTISLQNNNPFASLRLCIYILYSIFGNTVILFLVRMSGSGAEAVKIIKLKENKAHVVKALIISCRSSSRKLQALRKKTIPWQPMRQFWFSFTIKMSECNMWQEDKFWQYRQGHLLFKYRLFTCQFLFSACSFLLPNRLIKDQKLSPRHGSDQVWCVLQVLLFLSSGNRGLLVTASVELWILFPRLDQRGELNVPQLIILQPPTTRACPREHWFINCLSSSLMLI